MNTTQSSLLVRLRTREDSAAWSRFARIYTPLVHRWISQLGVEANQVNDLVQEVFIILHSKASSISERPPTKFRAWLRTVTLNKCRDHFRKQSRKSEPVFSSELEAAIADPAAVLTEHEYRMFVASSALRLMKDMFSETTWRACWESVVKDRPALEIASELGISENSVYLARSRVLKRLRTELDGLWD